MFHSPWNFIILSLKHDKDPTFKTFYFIRVALMAYGGSQTRGWIGAVAASLHHSHNSAGSETYLWPAPHSSQQSGILNTLSKVRDQTASPCILIGFINCWAETGTTLFFFNCTYLFYFKICLNCIEYQHRYDLFKQAMGPVYDLGCTVIFSQWGKK